MAMTLRSALDGIPRQVLLNPEFDLAACRDELITTFEIATRRSESPAGTPAKVTPQEKAT